MRSSDLKLHKTLFIILLSIITSSLTAQEICDNGIDDDNDGLIDLNDTTDCSCPFISVVESLFPNPSFDEFMQGEDCQSRQVNGAPDGSGQADCIAGWQQASGATTDAWHLITYNGNAPFWPAAIPQPVPNGLSVAGLFTSLVTNPDVDIYREYLGACLPGGPVEQGTEYRLNFQLGFAEPTVSPGLLVESPSTEEFAIYGILDCEDIPFVGESCPVPPLTNAWELITTFTASGTAPGWTNVEVDFIPDAPYAALAIGGACEFDTAPDGFESYRAYFFVDDLILNTVEEFESNISVGSISIFGDDICSDDARMMVQSFPGATYQWYRDGIAISGANSNEYYPPLGPDFPGLYSCRITRPDGCGIAGPVEFIRPLITNAFQDSAFICPDGSLLLLPSEVGATAQSYLWDDGSTELTRTITAPGTYSVTITSFCVETVETIVVTDEVPPNYTIEIVPEDFCVGDTISVTLRSDWQIPGRIWVDNDLPLYAVNETAQVVVANDTEIEFLASGSSCLSFADEVIDLNLDQFSFDVFFSALSCSQDQSEVVVFNMPGARTDFFWEWRDPNGSIVSTDTTYLATVPGIHQLTLTPIAGGCGSTETFDIPFIEFGDIVESAQVPTLNCANETGDIILNLTYPNTAVTVWEFNGQVIAEMTTVLTVTEPGLYELTAIALGDTGDTLCIQAYSYEVTYDDGDFTPAVELRSEDPCVASFTAILDNNYTQSGWQVDWFIAGDTDPIASGVDSLNGLGPGNYTFSLSQSGLDCTGAGAFSIDPIPTLGLQSQVLPFNCPDDGAATSSGSIRVIGINGTLPFTYVLTGPLDSTNNTGSFDGLPDGTYVVELTDVNGCRANQMDTLVVLSPVLPNVEAGEDVIINLGERIRLNLQINNNQDGQILWTPAESLSCNDCPNPTAFPLGRTTYFASVISPEGCVVSDSLSIDIITTGNVYVPNAFTPNLDGVNDLFQFFPDQSVQQLINFRVFDRWGAEVYVASEDTIAPIGWDGNAADGNPYNPGVYAYYLKVRLWNGQEREFSGVVNLLR